MTDTPSTEGMTGHIASRDARPGPSSRRPSLFGDEKAEGTQTADAPLGADGAKAPPAMAGPVGRLFIGFISLTNSAGTLWIFALMFLICADVLSRNLLNAPIRGVNELIGYSIVAATYLQLAHTLHSGRFTRADMVLGQLVRTRPVAAAVFHLVFSLFGLFVFLLIAYGTYFLFVDAWPDDKIGVPGEFTILVWPLRLIVLVGSAAVGVEFLRQGAASVKAMKTALDERARQVAKPDGKPAPIGWIAMVMLAAVMVAAAILFQTDVTKLEIGILSFIGMLALICLGMHIGVALITLGFVGIWMMGLPPIAVNSVKLASNEFLKSDVFGTVPLFVLMGLLVNESDIGKDTFNAARWALRGLKGGLGVATVAANAVFAAITGSSIASAAVFTKIAAPQMINSGYTSRFSVGTVAGSSVLGVLIPPSLLLIIYGFVTEQSVGILFLAAVIPGLILAFCMGLAIVGMAYLMPDFVGRPSNDDLEGTNFFTAFVGLVPIVILITAVLGGIYGGLFTPVEAGAVGAALALILALLKRRLSLASLWKVLLETGHITVGVLFLILAAKIYSQMLALSGLPQQMGAMMASADLGYFGFMAIYVLILILLGMFLDSVSIMLIILPLVLPLVNSLGIDPVGFGIITVVGLEMGLLTPPMGLCVYVVKSSLDDARVSLADIFKGAFPFVLIMLGVIALLVVFPALSNMNPVTPFKLLIGAVSSLFT